LKSVLEQSQIFGTKVIESIEKYMTISNVAFMKTLGVINSGRKRPGSKFCLQKENQRYFFQQARVKVAQTYI